MGKVSEQAIVSAPEPLYGEHELSSFVSGQASLDLWLKRRALKSQKSGAARTYVISLKTKQVVGYYSLAVGSVQRSEAPGSVRRNMPDPIPVMLLARLAMDENWQGQGLGRGMLKDAVLRTLQAAEIVGIRAMLVHALSEEAIRFYQYFGFKSSSFREATLMATLADLKDTLK